MVELDNVLRVLKDPVRRRIIRLLAEKGPLEYSELLRELGIRSTGRLNYHLKMLRDFISKDELGRYVLNDDGRYLYEFLQRFRSRNTVYTEESLFRIKVLYVGLVLLISSLISCVIHAYMGYTLFYLLSIIVYIVSFIITGSTITVFKVYQGSTKEAILGSTILYLLLTIPSINIVILFPPEGIYYIQLIPLRQLIVRFENLFIATSILLPSLLYYLWTKDLCRNGFKTVLKNSLVYYGLIVSITVILFLIDILLNKELISLIAYNSYRARMIHGTIVSTILWRTLCLLGAPVYIVIIYYLDRLLSKIS